MKIKVTLRAAFVAVLTMLSASMYAENEPVKYIDSDGQEKYVTDYKVIKGNEDYLESGWYVVNGDEEFIGGGGVFIDGDVSVVLCDGALWAPQTWIEAPVFYSGLHSSLRFYAQSTGENMGRVVSTGYGFCSVDTLEINGGYLMYDYTATETVSVYTVNFIMNGGKVVISNAYKGVSGETLCLNGGELDVSSSSLGIGVGKNLVFGKSYCDFVCNCTSFGYYGDDDIQIADYVRVKLGDKEYLSSIPYDITDVENITKMSTHYDEGLVAIESVSKKLEESDVWYTLTGVRLATEPIERGVYIHNGTKVCVR